MNEPAPIKVLIICSGNSARGILGEYLLRAKGKGRFEVYSAGANPTGQVSPLTFWVLQDRFGINASDARSKSWDEFKDINFDCVITVCDDAKEKCPVWPGKPVLAHWGSPEPTMADGTDEQKKRAFLNVALQIARRVDLLCALPPDEFDDMRLREIGEEMKSVTTTSPIPVNTG